MRDILARMCDAARGKPCVVDALYAAGFTAAEVIEYRTDVIGKLACENAKHWSPADARIARVCP